MDLSYCWAARGVYKLSLRELHRNYANHTMDDTSMNIIHLTLNGILELVRKDQSPQSESETDEEENRKLATDLLKTLVHHHEEILENNIEVQEDHIKINFHTLKTASRKRSTQSKETKIK